MGSLKERYHEILLEETKKARTGIKGAVCVDGDFEAAIRFAKEYHELELKKDKDENTIPIKSLITVNVPIDSQDYFINNVGCLRYSTNGGKVSSCVEPMDMNIYLEKDKHKIVGTSMFGEFKLVIIEPI